MTRALLICALVLFLLPASASAQSGGAPAPNQAGGMEYGTPVPPVRKKPRPKPPVASEFTVSPASLTPGAPITFSWRIDGGRGKVRVRVALLRHGSRAVARSLTYGRVQTGRRHTRTWTPRAGELAPGTYTARLHAVDAAGRVLVRTATASGRSRLEITVPPKTLTSGIFPVRGAWSFGDDGARFGADRGDHVHQGQDITAAKGTPLVSPVAGSVFFIDYQANGAGHYIVVRGEDGRDYVFMHLLEGSHAVKKGDVVAAGQQIGQVGSSGRSSGAHLHFELWPDGWYSSKASQPIDPRPELEAWASQTAR